MSIIEKLEDSLDELEVKYFVADKLEGSDYEGYVCIYIDSDDFSKEILEDLGFIKINSDLFYMKIDQFEELDEKSIQEVKLYHSEKYNINSKKDELRIRLVNLQEIWKEASDKILEINMFFLKEHGYEFFAPTLETLHRAFNLPSMLVKDERSCSDFCYFLYQIAYESVIEKTKDRLCQLLINKHPDLHKHKGAMKHLKEDLLENDPFYEDLLTLRHHYIHIKGSKKENPKENCKDMFRELYTRRGLKKVKNDFEYYQFELRILKEFLIFLDKIENIIKTEL